MNDALCQLIAEREQYISLSRILLSAVEESNETLKRARGLLKVTDTGMITDINYQLDDNDSVIVRARKQLANFPS